MNENIDLTKILKDCPIGTKLYSTLCGEVKLKKVENDKYPIGIENNDGDRFWLTKDGKYIFGSGSDGECILFPSKEQRDWSKFTAPWYKKEKFDPNTLKPFDRVLVRDYSDNEWVCSIFSHIQQEYSFHYVCITNSNWKYCIPYNEDTKYLVGKREEAPDYYKYW